MQSAFNLMENTIMEHAIQFDSYALIAGAAVNRPLVGRLLRMAEQYQSEGSIRQATEMFWTLAEDYQGTPPRRRCWKWPKAMSVTMPGTWRAACTRD